MKMKILQRAIKSLDFFGGQVNFTINRQDTYKTFLGGLMSIVICGLYISFFFLFGLDMIYKLNPNVNLETIYPDKQENFSITNETFIAYRIAAFDDSSIMQTQIKPFIAHVIYDNINRTYIHWEEFKAISCSDNRFKHYFENSIYKPNEWICFDFSGIPNHELYGGYSNPYNSYIQFYLDICELELKPNFFRKTNCTDYKQLRRFLFENKNVLRVSIPGNNIQS